MPINPTHPIHTQKPIGSDYMRGVQQVSLRITVDNIDTVLTFPERIGPGVVTDVKTVKKTDFDSGTSDVLDVGTSADADGLVDGQDLSGSTPLGLVRSTLKDTAVAYLDAATELTAEWISAGTAPTEGEVVVIVEWLPDTSIYNAP